MGQKLEDPLYPEGVPAGFCWALAEKSQQWGMWPSAAHPEPWPRLPPGHKATCHLSLLGGGGGMGLKSWRTCSEGRARPFLHTVCVSIRAGRCLELTRSKRSMEQGWPRPGAHSVGIRDTWATWLPGGALSPRVHMHETSLRISHGSNTRGSQEVCDSHLKETGWTHLASVFSSNLVQTWSDLFHKGCGLVGPQPGGEPPSPPYHLLSPSCR